MTNLTKITKQEAREAIIDSINFISDENPNLKGISFANAVSVRLDDFYDINVVVEPWVYDIFCEELSN